MRARLIILILCLFYGKENLFAQATEVTDTSRFHITRPSPEKEKVIFSDPELQYDIKVKVNKSFFQELLEWLSEKLFGKNDYQTERTVRSMIIWTIVIICLIIIVWLLSKSEMAGLIRKKGKATSFNFTDITEDLTDINFQEKINHALQTGNLRLAVRWHYLKMLFNLDKHQQIEFAPHKTNIDYRHELSNKKEKSHLKGFIDLSRIYEYVWYGQFSITENDYRNYEKEFDDYLKNPGV